MPQSAVCGIFRNRIDLEGAAHSLQEQGVRNTAMSLLLFPVPEVFVYSAGGSAPDGGEAAGSAGGGSPEWPGALHALARPGTGPVIAAGPIAEYLAQAAGDSIVGGLPRALSGLGMQEYDARRYERRIKAGGILLAVHCESDAATRRAEKLLALHGAEDIVLIPAPGKPFLRRAG